MVKTKFFFKSLHSLGSSSTGTCSISTTPFTPPPLFGLISSTSPGP
jgi:hypothetical protein